MITGITGKQELFNYVARHLLKQNAQSRGKVNDIDDTCVYRGSGGLQCAAGCLIDPEFYDKDFEGQGFNKPIIKALELSLGRPIGAIDEKTERWFVPGSELEMLNELRMVHDDHDPSEWKQRLRSVAATYELESIPELQETA